MASITPLGPMKITFGDQIVEVNHSPNGPNGADGAEGETGQRKSRLAIPPSSKLKNNPKIKDWSLEIRRRRAEKKELSLSRK